MKKGKLRLQEAWVALKMVLSWVVSKCVSQEPDLWLFSERGTDARDNGMWMFKYIKENHPEINAKYVITNDSEDRPNLQEWEDSLITTESFRHYVLMWQSKLCVSTHICGCFPAFVKKVIPFRKFVYNHSKVKVVLLQHGVIKDNMLVYHYGDTCIDLFISGAKPEYDYLKAVYGYPEGVIQYTGLARFDNLHSLRETKRQILVMPTWRSWLRSEQLPGSDYYNHYVELLQNKKLQQLLIDHQIKLVFYPHYEIQQFIGYFQKLELPDCMVIADKAHYDVQQLLMESQLLITDYSSVFFDFVYMDKPVLYYQFDEAVFRSRHYQSGYYDYRDGLGPWTDDLNTLIHFVEKEIAAGFAVPLPYKEKRKEYFPLCDSHNRERIYNQIVGLQKKVK